MARPTEIKAITELLTQNWDNATDLAKTIIQTLDNARAERTSYIIAAGNSPRIQDLVPFPTPIQASKAIEQQTFTMLDVDLANINPVQPPVALATLWDPTDTSPVAPEALKTWGIK